MNNVKCDKRIIKTKRAIKNAFVSLLGDKDFTQITVTDIAESADVDRKTIYNYYSGVFAIQEEIESDFADFLSGVLDESKEIIIENPLGIFEILTESLRKNEEFYTRLMRIDANSHLLRKIKSVVKEKIRHVLVNYGVNKPELVAEYVTAGMVAAYQSWFNSPSDMTLHDFSNEVGKLVFSGIGGFVNK